MPQFDKDLLNNFEETIHKWIRTGEYDRTKIIKLFNTTVENFDHKDTENSDNRMYFYAAVFDVFFSYDCFVVPRSFFTCIC